MHIETSKAMNYMITKAGGTMVPRLQPPAPAAGRPAAARPPPPPPRCPRARQTLPPNAPTRPPAAPARCHINYTRNTVLQLAACTYSVASAYSNLL